MQEISWSDAVQKGIVTQEQALAVQKEYLKTLVEKKLISYTQARLLCPEFDLSVFDDVFAATPQDFEGLALDRTLEQQEESVSPTVFKFRPVAVFACFAVFCILVGLISVTASNWDKIPVAVKLVGGFLLTGGCLFGTLATAERPRKTAANAFTVASVGMIGAMIGLVAQIYNIGFEFFGKSLFLWVCLATPLFWFSFFKHARAIWTVLFLFFVHAVSPLVGAVFLCAAAPLMFRLKEKPLPFFWWADLLIVLIAVEPVWAVCFLLALLPSVLKSDSRVVPVFWWGLLFIEGIVVPQVADFIEKMTRYTAPLTRVLCAAAYLTAMGIVLNRFVSCKRFVKAFAMFFGTVGLCAVYFLDVLYFFGFEFFGNGRILPLNSGRALVLAAAAFGVSAAAGKLFLTEKSRRYFFAALANGAVFALIAAFTASPVSVVFFNVNVLAVICIVLVKKGKIKAFNGVAFLMFLRIILAYLQLSGSLATTGVGLIGLGVCILAVLHVWLKYQQRIVTLIKEI